MADRGAASGERLTGRTLYGYGLGSVAQGVARQALSTSIVSQFLFLVIGMPALLVGAAIVISQIVDAVVDPLLSMFASLVLFTLLYLAGWGLWHYWTAPDEPPPSQHLNRPQ